MYWRGHVEAWRRSGLSQAGYCRQEAISLKSFGYWKRRLEAEIHEVTSKPAIVPVSFIPLAATKTSEPVLLFAGGYQIELHGDFCTMALKKLLSVLDQTR